MHLQALALRDAVLAMSLGLMAPWSLAQELVAEWDSQHGARRQDDMFGECIAYLGDVDKDGWPEVVVGSTGYDVSRSDALEGAVFVVSTKDGSFLHQHFGSSKLARMGRSVAAGADLNGDGIPDYLAGAPDETGSKFENGRVHVYSGADGSELYVLEGHRSGDDFGWNAVLIDDLDQDGTSEIIVTAPSWDNVPIGTVQCGRGYCFSGATGAILWTFDGSTNYQSLGWCCPLDDFNGDGVLEVGFGSSGSGAGPNGEGAFDVVDGRNGTSQLQLHGKKPLDFFGVCGRTGDIDRDGVRDVLIGAAGHSATAYLAGRMYLYSGATFTLLQQWDGEAAKEYLGIVPQRFGQFDADCDGWDDVVFGASNRPRAGCKDGVLLMYSGRTGRLLYELRSRPEWTMADAFGVSGTPVGDLTGDGLTDIVVGAVGADGIPPSGLEGHAYLFGMKRIFIQCDQGEYWPGDPITLQLRGGAPGVLGLIAVVGVDGVPVFESVALGTLDAHGELTLNDAADSSLTGLTIEFIGFCQKPSGRGLLTSTVDFVHVH